MDQRAFPTQLQRLTDWLTALWKFSRPHTIIGTSLSVVGLAVIALAAVSTPQVWVDHAGTTAVLIIEALVSCLCANVYIVGLNQLEDVEIDQINKPDLPIASGALSRNEGLIIVGVAGVLSVVLSFLAGPFLLGTVIASLAIGTAYSLPPIRLKRFPFWAALCIYSVRGLVVNLGIFLHFQQRFGGADQASIQIPSEVFALSAFVVIFAYVIAIFKDIPDEKGDQQFDIRTLTLRLGTAAVYNLSLWVLTAAYSAMIITTVLGWIPVQPIFLIGSHLVLIGLLWFWSSKVDLKEKGQVSAFYQFIWKLFFLEYIVFPTACLLNATV